MQKIIAYKDRQGKIHVSKSAALKSDYSHGVMTVIKQLFKQTNCSGNYAQSFYIEAERIVTAMITNQIPISSVITDFLELSTLYQQIAEAEQKEEPEEIAF